MAAMFLAVILFALFGSCENVQAATTYTVKYNANGGSGAPATQTKQQNVRLLLSSQRPTRQHYTFKGWGLSSTSTTSSYSPGSNYSNNANITLYAIWEGEKFTVTFNANGGSGAPSSQTKVYGTDLRLSSTKPRRTGYTFTGWKLNANNTYVSYLAGGLYKDNKSITLYAGWDPDQFKITFNANGGSGGPGTLTKYYGTDLIIPTNNMPSRGNYWLVGWSTNSRATSATYYSGDRFTTNATTTLYAVWQEYTYTIKFNMNGGSGSIANQTKYATKNLVLSSTKPTRTGYDFLGWATTQTATKATYNPGQNITENKDLTLYAVWQKQTYQITYDANGGTGAPATQTKTYGTSIYLSSTKPTRTGYTFLGWGTSKTATTVSYNSGVSYSQNAALSLYAVWQELTYTISFNMNGGSGGPSAQTKYYSKSLTLPTTVPTKTGYDFKGWSTSSYGSVNYNPGGSFATNANTTLYAVWAAKTYKITYNVNGGSGSIAAQTKTHGSNIYLTSTKPARTGYVFQGWGTSASATTVSYSSGSLYSANADITLYAVWKAETYTVTYNANGGSGAPSAQTKTHGVNLTLSGTKPTRSNYDFLGWSTSSSATTASYSSGGTFTVNANTTLYAVWKIKSYTITYNANGGSGAPSAQSKNHGASVTLSTAKPARTGYDFSGWSANSSAASASYSAGSVYSANADITLYAVWTPKVYTIRYNANGGSGAPAAQSKTHGRSINLSSQTFMKRGSRFLGWSTSSTASSAMYGPGAAYSAEGDATLYAVYSYTGYDFSIGSLLVSSSDIYVHDTVTVSCTMTNRDLYNAYSGIPVELVYDGTVLGSSSAGFVAGGSTTATFSLFVGGTVGTHSIEVRINYSKRAEEDNTENNVAASSIEVQDKTDLTAEVIGTEDPEGDEGGPGGAGGIGGGGSENTYTAGTEVITSFYVKNESSKDILPDDNLDFSFRAYYYRTGQQIEVTEQTAMQVVVPANGRNLVWFTWYVPEEAAGTYVYLKGTVNSSGAYSELDLTNNSNESSVWVTAKPVMEAADPGYSETVPAGYQGKTANPAAAGQKTWNVWEYENGALVIKSYGARLTCVRAEITPASGTGAYQQSGKWYMGSGYGYSLTYEPRITAVSGCQAADDSMVTGVQNATARYKEYNYALGAGKCTTLECDSGAFLFTANGEGERLHYTPVWLPDGEYAVNVDAGECWTPAGRLRGTVVTNAIVIEGSMYDDYYYGR